MSVKGGRGRIRCPGLVLNLRSNHLAPHGGALKNPPPMRPALIAPSPSLIVTRLAIPRSADSDRRVFISVIAHDEGREKKGNVDRTTRLQIYRLRGCVPNWRGSSWLPLHGDCTYRLGEETAAYCLLRFRGTPGNPKEATVMAESSTG